MTHEHLHTNEAAHDIAAASPDGTADRTEPTLGALVSSLVRSTPDTILALCVILGLVGSGALALAVSLYSRAIPPLILLSAFGAWGMVDRVHHTTSGGRMGVALARAIIILVSFAAVGAMILTFLGVAIGTWIS